MIVIDTFKSPAANLFIMSKAVVQEKSSFLWWLLPVIGGILLLLCIIAIPFIVILIPDNIESGNVAVIEIRGIIMEDGVSFSGDITAASEIVAYINDANEDPLIRAIVLDINSPGGSAVASDEIASALKQSSKPTVALIHEIGTSGAYWVASAADTIIANRMSITGSIGVIASYLEFSKLMDDYGITYQRLVAGKYKDVGTPFKKLSTDEQQLLQSKLDKIHDAFITEIAENRDLTKAQVRAVATGEFFLGDEAQKYGLVDMLGSSTELELHLKEVLGIEEIEYAHYQREPTLFDVLSQVASEFSFSVGKGIGSSLTEQKPLIVA
ncbi:MAG TPA: signal peptide peptidase SppA [Candidatus Nanoarchaeia archaeon]|nr:signal peptide peptidase SppA [Candidatus Nanoarchaeia archaeon]